MEKYMNLIPASIIGFFVGLLIGFLTVWWIGVIAGIIATGICLMGFAGADDAFDLLD